MHSNCIKLASENLAEISHSAAELIQTRKIAQYQDLPLEILVRYVQPELEMQLRYLEEGNLNEWQTFIERVVIERLQQGLDYTSIVKAEQCLVDALGQFFQTIPASLDDAKSQASLQRRLQGIHIVASSVTIRVGLKFREEKSALGQRFGGLSRN